MNFFERFALITAVGASSATSLGAQRAAQDIPEPALRQLLLHLVRSESKRERRIAFALVTQRFRDKASAGDAARSAGFAVYEGRAQILGCANSAPPTCSFASGDRVADLQEARANGDTITVRIVVSTFVRRTSGEGRLFGVFREIILVRTDGLWQVRGDRILFRE